MNREPDNGGRALRSAFPYIREKIIGGEVAAVGEQECFEHAELFRGEGQGRAVPFGDSAEGVEPDRPCREHNRIPSCGSASERTQPCQEFDVSEGFSQVIVRPEIEAGYAVVEGPCGSEHEDPHGWSWSRRTRQTASPWS